VQTNLFLLESASLKSSSGDVRVAKFLELLNTPEDIYTEDANRDQTKQKSLLSCSSAYQLSSKYHLQIAATNLLGRIYTGYSKTQDTPPTQGNNY
jgi:hypothetical protein